MKQTLWVIGGLIILTLIGTVLWQITNQSPTSIEPVACTLEAKLCADGSAVGRVGPDCEFVQCPDTQTELVPEPTPRPIPSAPIPSPVEPVACTMDAKQCPDGSYVGRVGPDCKFSPCPSEHMPMIDSMECSEESRMVDACIEIYQPVCGQVRVECITTPCDPVSQTFSNSCFACMNERVLSYTEGACVDS